MKKLLIVGLWLMSGMVLGQSVDVSPTITPEQVTAEETITIEYDVTGTDLESLSDAWLWLWLPDVENGDAPSNVNPAASADAADPAKMTKTEEDGKTAFSIELTLTEFTGKSADEIKKVGVLLKGSDWDDGQTVDYTFEVGTGDASGVHEIRPTITPTFPSVYDPITIEYDVTNSPLNGLEEAWLWLWTPENSTILVPSNVNPASSDAAASEPAKFEKKSVDGKTIFSITIDLSEFVSGPLHDVKKIGMLIKGNDWPDGQSNDYVLEFSEGFALIVNSPVENRAYLEQGDNVSLDIETSESARFDLYVDGVLTKSEFAITSFEYTHTAITDGNTHQLVTYAINDDDSLIHRYSYVTAPKVSDKDMPMGLVNGPNYHDGDTSATLVFTAPGKESVYVIGDFNDWLLNQDFLMYKDGNKFWVTINGLIPGKEYIYQYLVDGEIEVGDPYTEKISSKWDDAQIIAEDRYPGLSPHPSDQTQNEASYLQTKRPEFEWKNVDFAKPAKEDLVIYELLIRDFTDVRTYQAVTDKLDYLDSLGVNAIELMPVMEFEGNLSWGYNTAFKLAPDKFYGTEQALKTLIDEAHGRGMAIVLDIVLNHHFGRSPLYKLYEDKVNNRPADDNVWFNKTPKHDFNVGYDFNHESSYTVDYVDRVVKYWLEEYHVDGYRFDLSKGFTQKNTLGNVGLWGEYDQSRVNILNHIAETVWSVDENAYVILEHFADNVEEKALSENGMMLWGNMNHAYRNTAKGGTDSFSWLHHESRDWTEPHVVGYMSSHDEERPAWDAFENGSESFDFHLTRLQMNAAFFFTIPGPKMIWQFEEFGYDEELNNDRLDVKPTRWEYLEDPDRQRLFAVYQSLINLKTQTDYLDNQYFDWSPSGAFKWITFDHPEVQFTIYGNFSKSASSGNPHFLTEGEWYNYFTGEKINVSSISEDVTLAPGEFYIYTSEPIDNYININPINPLLGVETELTKNLIVYPNPTSGEVKIQFDQKIKEVRVTDLTGREWIRKSVNENQSKVDLSSLPTGIYVVSVESAGKVINKRIIKH